MRKAFTLVELLVVVCIVVLVVGLIVPAVIVARKMAANARVESDMRSIAVALEAYRQDFGDYPRLDPDAKAPGDDPITNDLANPAYLYGAELLCWALVGPYPADGAGGFVPGDGADGSGFRISRGDDGVARGQVYSSYLNVDRFKIGRDSRFPRYAALLDYNDHQILYFAAKPGRSTSMILVDGAWVEVLDIRDPAKGYALRSDLSLWDFRDNEPAFSVTGTDRADRLARWQRAMGDANASGLSEPDEIPITAPFLLWSAGRDETYGTADDIKVMP